MNNNNVVLRIGTFNNYNFTPEENDHVNDLEKSYPMLFVNSNSFKPIESTFKSFVTINPYLDKFIKPKGDISNIKAFRVKYVYDSTRSVSLAFNESIDYARSVKIPVLITLMRFRRIITIDKFTNFRNGYSYIRPYYRLNNDLKNNLCRMFKKQGLFICDENGTGCPDCLNCSKLTYGIETDIYEINLRESGVCRYSCPDCFAQDLVRKNGGRIAYDKVKQNYKQSGKVNNH